jgi:hypothetical protein
MKPQYWIGIIASISARELTTSNDSLNPPMLAVNRKLGYTPQNGQYKLKNETPI